MRVILATAFSLAAAAGAHAQEFGFSDFGLETGASSLGLFVAPSAAVTSGFRLRAPLYFGQLDRDFDIDGNDVEADLTFASGAILVDYMFGDTGLRLSGGLGFGGYSASASNDELEFDGTTYNADFDLDFEQENMVAPMIAFGYTYMFTERFGVTAELGAKFARYNLDVDGQDALPAAERAQFEDDLDDVNDDLGALSATPFISLGLSLKF